MNLGFWTLNCSLILYTVFYLPQLCHNAKFKRYHRMSMGFHSLLLLSACADLVYAYSIIAQWQYRAVAVLTFVYLLIQHLQLLRHASLGAMQSRIMNGLTLLCVAVILGVVFLAQHAQPLTRLGIVCGWLERIGNTIYLWPQWFKNRTEKHSGTLSVSFLWLVALTTACDSVSAWWFHWGPSSRYGTPLALVVIILLLYQRYQRPFTHTNEEQLCTQQP